MIGNILRVVQGWVKLKGATDGTMIGNVGDRLKVDSLVSSYPPACLITEEMDVARKFELSSSFQDVYTYTGTGYFISLMLNFETDDKCYMRVVIDGNDVLIGTDGLLNKDARDNNIFDIKDVGDHMDVCGIGVHDDTLRYTPQLPIKFETSVVIKARSTDSKDLRAGLITLCKES